VTKKDFIESVNAVLVEELEDSVTAAELQDLQRKLVARVESDWDPFEPEDIFDDRPGDPDDLPRSSRESSYSYTREVGDDHEDDED
jgi:hypothetical protein